jgi:hypothetical protein
MSRTTSIAGVRPLGWLARVRAHRKCLAWACPVQLLGAAGLAPITALGMGARDDHARQRSGPGQGWCIRKSEKLLETGRGSEERQPRSARCALMTLGQPSSDELLSTPTMILRWGHAAAPFHISISYPLEPESS